jgi:hypothetical protein
LITPYIAAGRVTIIEEQIKHPLIQNDTVGIGRYDCSNVHLVTHCYSASSITSPNHLSLLWQTLPP